MNCESSLPVRVITRLAAAVLGATPGLLLRYTPLRMSWWAVALLGAAIGLGLTLPRVRIRRTVRLLIALLLKHVHLASDEALDWVDAGKSSSTPQLEQDPHRESSAAITAQHRDVRAPKRPPLFGCSALSLAGLGCLLLVCWARVREQHPDLTPVDSAATDLQKGSQELRKAISESDAEARSSHQENGQGSPLKKEH